MPDDANDEVTSSIAAKFSDCLGSYRQLYFLLTSRHVRGLQDVDLTEVSDNYGRLNVWGADSGALHIGRGSLDDILRTDKNLRSILLDLLEDLLEGIGRAVLAFQETEDVSTNNDLTAHDDHQDSESNTSTASEQSDDGESGTRPEENNAQFLISIIFAYIRSLYKLSKSLRRFTVHGDYSLTVSKYADASLFASWDQGYIGNRFPNATRFLVHRLALANTRRRQQLQYWKEHHTVPSQDDTSLSEGRDTVYAPSLAEKNRSFSILDFLNVPADQASFECSYCHAHLDAVTMTQRGVWKRHVFGDLRPYVCTYQDCPNAEKMYITRHEWLHHEQQMHQRSWICWNGCEPKFKSAQLLSDHILHHHSGKFIESQLPVLLDMCERAADPDEEESCSLCGQQMNLEALRLHVAFHLEDIALFGQPFPSDRSETDASSGRASYPLERIAHVVKENEGARDPAVSHSPKSLSTALWSLRRLRLMSISCLVLYEPLALDYSKQPRRSVSDGGGSVWVPPNRKDAYSRDDHGAKLFRWRGGRMTDMTTQALNKECTLYSVATVCVFGRDAAKLIAVQIDARKENVAEQLGGWKELSFDWIPLGLGMGSYAAVTVAGDQPRIAGPFRSRWMNQLLPATYLDNGPDELLGSRFTTGLIGSLPLLFALPAFSAQLDQLSNVLAGFVRPNRWLPHELPHGYDDERGMVVSVFLDPDNKEGSTQGILNCMEDGYFGPFYS